MWRGSPASNQIGLVDLESGALSVIADGTFARFMAPGRVIIGASSGQLLVGTLDQRNRKLTGTPMLALDRVQGENSNGTIQFGVASNGTLVYQKRIGGNVGVVWVDRAGVMTKVDTSLVGDFQSPALSPDGNSIALAVGTGSGSEVWVKQLTTGSFTQLSSDTKNADRPMWSPDGRNIAFLGGLTARRTAWLRRADGSDKVAPFLKHPAPFDEVQFERTGRYTIFRSEGSGQGTRHLMMMERGVDTVPRMLIREKYDTYAISLSPDGRWLAYVSEESGAREVYVRPFPNIDAAKFAISVGGGMEPLWRRDGSELFFRNPRGDMYAVPVTSGPTFTRGAQKLLFSRPGLTIQDYYRNYDVSTDGKRFLMLDGGGGETKSLNVIFNWGKQLDRLARK
jgi:eukaryotic-like serine/threonine-protein kinase